MNEKVYLPPGSYTITNEEKRAICKCLCGIRVPIGFSTNIKNLVSILELKMSGSNTHDCHAISSLFLAIAINHPY
jgi:ppGpp synthetase/RelA/SpoT-type nucleotidyltranferase